MSYYNITRYIKKYKPVKAQYWFRIGRLFNKLFTSKNKELRPIEVMTAAGEPDQRRLHWSAYLVDNWVLMRKEKAGSSKLKFFVTNYSFENGVAKHFWDSSPNLFYGNKVNVNKESNKYREESFVGELDSGFKKELITQGTGVKWIWF